MTSRGLFVSDLHLLSRRTAAQKHWQHLAAELPKYDLLVLGGDIFDFRWSTHGDLLRSAEAAREWLQKVLETNKHLKVVYTLGNHDCLPAMQTVLENLAQEVPQFCWTEQHVVLGEAIFLHGDILDAGPTQASLINYRSKFSDQHREKGDLAHRMYDLLVASRIHGVPPKILHRPARVTKRLSDYLATLELTAEQGIRDVYFGHTHQPLPGVMYQQQSFHNPGSGIKHLPFLPCPFTVNVDLDQVVAKLTAHPKEPLRFQP